MKKSAFFKRIEDIQARYHGKHSATETQTGALADIAGLTPQSLLNEAVRRAFANGATPLVLEMAMQQAIKKHLAGRSEHSGHSVSFSQTVRALRAPTLLPKIPQRPVSGTVLPFVRLRGFSPTLRK